MKRYLSLFLLLAMVLALLSGCGKDPKPTTPETTPPATTPPPTATQTQPGGLTDYDPDREIFILCDNSYYTIYAGLSAAPDYSFHILSKRELDTRTVRVDIPIAAGYTVAVKEVPLSGEGYFAYRVDVDVPKALARQEAFTEMTVEIEGTAYHEQVGEVRFETEFADMEYFDGNIQPWGCDQDPGLYNDGLYYAAGVFTFTAGDSGAAISELRVLNPETELVELIAHRWTADNLVYGVNAWDQKNRLIVPGALQYANHIQNPDHPIVHGDTITFDLILKDPSAELLNYQTKLWVQVDYAVHYADAKRDGQYTEGERFALIECHILRCSEKDLYNVCRIVFEGKDLEKEYLRAHAQDQWREKFG